MCRDGLEEMQRDAQAALEGLSPTSPYRSAIFHAEGASHLLGGDTDLAEDCFARAMTEATMHGLGPFIPLLLAERGIVAIARGDWAAAERLASEALEIMQPEFDDYWTSALPYAWAARVAGHRADLSSARDLAARGRDSDHCSRTRFPSCLPRRCWSWHTPTLRSPTREGRAPPFARCTTSSTADRRSVRSRDKRPS